MLEWCLGAAPGRLLSRVTRAIGALPARHVIDVVGNVVPAPSWLGRARRSSPGRIDSWGESMRRRTALDLDRGLIRRGCSGACGKR